MTERLRPPHVAARSVPTLPPRAEAVEPPEERDTILGFPAEVADDDQDADDERPDVLLVALRRPDRFAAGTLVLAGVSAATSLLLEWGPGEDADGLALVLQGVDALRGGMAGLVAGSAWPPLAVVLAGAVLTVLGLLALVPARGHRALGVLALLVTSAAVAAVVVLLAAAGWRVERSQLGTWFAVAVPGLGLLGALKAMLTAPRMTVGPR